MTIKKRLFDMEIDEISLVDNGANQHASIVISKALDSEEAPMSVSPDVLYDAEGDLVEYDLEDGDVVYDDEGNEYVFVVENEDEDEQTSQESDEDEGEYEYAEPQYEYGKSEEFKPGVPKKKKGKKGVPSEEGEEVTTSKSLGDIVLEELSKAANEDQRSEVIAKAMHEVEIAKAAAEEAWERVAKQEDAMLTDAFISKAAEYNLPVDPVEFGQILKAASTVLSSQQLDTLDQLFSSVGDVLYDEIGYVGDTDNASVLDVVNGYVGELIGKADASPEQLQAAIFENNPDAYDAYLQENWR